MTFSAAQRLAYFARIGLDSALQPDRAGLERLQRAHRFAIPFENLDISLGRGISLDPERLFGKLVTARRGGYCFEQNGLFLGMGRSAGFALRPLLARVWLEAEGVPPRTHTANLATLDGEDWLVDVGFGGSFVPPLRLAAGAGAATADGARHRLSHDRDHGWMLERDNGAGWQRQYSFTLDPVWPADLVQANHFTATCPGTRFTTLRIASSPTADGYASLVERKLTTAQMSVSEAREIEDAEAYRQVLAKIFGLSLTPQEVAALALFEGAAPS